MLDKHVHLIYVICSGKQNQDLLLICTNTCTFEFGLIIDYQLVVKPNLKLST